MPGEMVNVRESEKKKVYVFAISDCGFRQLK